MTIVNLYDGKHIESWLIAEDDEFVELAIHYNGVVLTLPKELIPELSMEIKRVAEALVSREHRN